MNAVRKLFFLLVFLTTVLSSRAQDENKQTEMADLMRSNGMIYVVVAVVLTILLGLILYLVRIERKVRKMEKETNDRF